MHKVIAHHLPTNTQAVPKPSATLSQLPQFYCSSQCHTAWNTPLYGLDKLFWFCPIPASCDTCLLALRTPQAVEECLTYYKNYSSSTKESEFQNHQNSFFISLGDSYCNTINMAYSNQKHEKLKCLWFSARNAQLQLRHYSHLRSKPQHCTVRKKIIPAETRADVYTGKFWNICKVLIL